MCNQPTLFYDRRKLLAFGAALLPSALAGCGLVSTNSPFWATAAAAFGGEQPAPVSREQADALPYASILAWAEGGSKAFMVLGEVDGQRLVWYSAARQIIVTQGAFIVRTSGLERDLTGMSFQPADTPDLSAPPAQVVRSIDVDSLKVFGWSARSSFTRRGTETVRILERDYTLAVIEENVVGQTSAPWRNLYWVDTATGFCWKSRQTLFPNGPVLNLEIIKPFA